MVNSEGQTKNSKHIWLWQWKVQLQATGWMISDLPSKSWHPKSSQSLTGQNQNPWQVRHCHDNMWQCDFKYDEKQRKLFLLKLYESKNVFFCLILWLTWVHIVNVSYKAASFLVLLFLCPAKYLSHYHIISLWWVKCWKMILYTFLLLINPMKFYWWKEY